MPGKDRLEYDVIANDKASTVMDKVAAAGKQIGTGLATGAGKGAAALKQLFKGAKDTEGALGKLGGAGKEGLGKLAEGFKAGPLAFIGIGAGLGAAVADGFSQAMEKQDATAVLSAQVGATNAQMGKLGKISGDLYKDAFGESVQEIDGVLKSVFQSGLAAVSDGEDRIKGITAQVMNYAKITGEEALPVTRAVSQMLKTGLAKNATEAFDLLTRGVQKGLDSSEDLLDTTNEYGTQFRKVGLTGQQAFGLISQAMKNGARDSDIAADAIKEFSIRAQDGSTTAAASYKALGLNAKQMSKDVAGGGPKAAAALDLVLDRLRKAKDRADFSTIAFGLFGTQSEDLGDALKGMDLSTAAAEMGKVGGAASRAGDLINDTASNKLTTMKRAIQTSIVDAIGKYALPKLEEFADWFNGPGKMVVVAWAIQAARGFLTFADGALGALGTMTGALGKFSKVAMLAAAAIVAPFDPNLAYDMIKQADAMEEWANGATKDIGNARDALKGWGTTLENTEKTVKLQANIESLDQQLAKAQKELKDPGLTKERKAILTADISRLTREKDAALRALGNPDLIKARVAQLQANKTDLDTKIANAKTALKDPKLSATTRAQLEATIAQLLRQKASAQAAINNLTGKTVVISAEVRINSANIQRKVQNQLDRLGLQGLAKGGPAKKGQTYVVGEKRPELFVPDEDGQIIPQVPAGFGGGSRAAMSYGGGGGGMVTLNFDDSEVGRFMLNMVRKAISNSGSGGNVQLALGGRAV